MSLLDQHGAPARWTVVLGENGVGKTTLLQMLALLAAKSPREIEHLLDFEMFQRDRWGPPRRRMRRLRHGLVRGEGHHDSDHRGRATAALRSQRRDRDQSILESQIGWTTPERTRVSPFLCGYGAARRLEEGGLKRRWREDDSTLSLFCDAALRDGEEWLLQADYAAAREPTAQARRKLEVVKELLVRVLPETSEVRVGKVHGTTTQVSRPRRRTAGCHSAASASGIRP
jgi:energy-coupling factor transporter ATP-binding protein EcfA2